VRESAVDIYSLIKKDHAEIANLFRRLKAAEGFSETSEQLFAQLREDLELHAHAEERVWYAALQEAEGTQELVEEALDDHALVQNLLDELAALCMDEETWNEKLEVLEEHVKGHVEEEEGDIFDAAYRLFSAEQAAKLAQRWQTAKQEHMARNAK
jgi:molybdopterin converting factor small subunit